MYNILQYIIPGMIQHQYWYIRLQDLIATSIQNEGIRTSKDPLEDSIRRYIQQAYCRISPKLASSQEEQAFFSKVLCGE